jgi:tetratricopeptide (TPR) repeat protein
MFLDADEVFQDVSDIIEFFNSGEYKAFSSASHPRYEAGSGSYSEIVRLFRRDQDTRFIGKIHEYIPAKEPIKELKSVSHPTGYNYAGEEGRKKREAKYERNIRPLLEMHRKDPGDLHTIYHIVNENMLNGRYDEVDKFLEIGLKLRAKNTSDIYYHSLRRLNIGRFANTEQSQRTVDAVRGYFNDASKLFSFAPELRMIEARALAKEGRHDEAISAFKEVIRLFEEYKAGGLSTDDIKYTITLKPPEDTASKAAGGIAGQYAALGDYDAAARWIKDYGLEVSEMLNPLRIGEPVTADELERYIRAACKYITDADNLPERDRFIFGAAKAYQDRDAGDIPGFVSQLRKALKFDGTMNAAVLAAVKDIEPETDVKDALAKQTAAVKAAIYKLIEGGRLEEASKALELYRGVNPLDPDINIIYNIIHNR